MIFNVPVFQAKNGIVNEQKQPATAKLAALATSGEAGKVAVPNPGSKAVDRSSEYLYLLTYYRRLHLT